ncbi:type VI secretion system protein TssA [Archangium violaceum]|uniref:type VI secretion system protein TssA n=1 Tax=Archangium violaceum TaxID=83451 RepID=UPI00193C22D8|nr:type VI secretion system protein TssA [Archangium violaceum]QRK05082.1 type VI secretion system protein TssA [Archangium violaceum]
MTDTTSASPPDLQSLLQPISPEAPSGRNLRYEPIYEHIREARREDDPSLPQGVWQVSLKRADWAQVSALCQQALARETKDLQLAVWLTEAWVMQQGFTGLRWGLNLSTALVEHFWDTLWPTLDDGDPEARLSLLKWLDDKLFIALGKQPLIRPPAPGAVTYGFADWQQILLREKQPGKQEDAKKKEQPDGTDPPPLTRERFMAAASQIPAPTFVALAQQLTDALEAISALEQALDTRLDQTSAALRRTRAVLGDIQALIALLKSNASHSLTDDPPEVTTEPGAPSPPLGPGQVPSVIRSRKEAYLLLGHAADYLLRTEPHSPVPYLVKRAMAWGQLSLDKLLEELVPDSSSVEALHTLLGMKQRE